MALRQFARVLAAWESSGADGLPVVVVVAVPGCTGVDVFPIAPPVATCSSFSTFATLSLLPHLILLLDLIILPNLTLAPNLTLFDLTLAPKLTSFPNLSFS